MKRLLIAIIPFFVLNGCINQNKNEISIGAILPLTGDAALYGNNSKEGIDLAVEIINSEGGVLGKKINVIYEDSKAEPRTGVAAFKKLTEIEKVQSVIGDITSTVTLAIAPLAEEKKVVVLSPAATAPKISEAGKYIFRNWTSDDYEAKVISDYMLGKLNISRLAILYLNNDYGIGLEQAINKEFKKLGKELLISESFTQNQLDFRANLTKIKNLSPDALYIISYPVETINILKQIKELGIKLLLFSTSAFQDEMIIKNAGNTADKVIYPYPVSPDTTNTTASTFYSLFKKKYNKSPGIVADTGYDALLMLVAAIKSENSSNGESIQIGLMKLHDYMGASGKMSFDENGDIQKEMKIKTVKNGKFIDL